MKKNIGIFLVMCIMLTACKNDKFPYDDELDDSEKNEISTEYDSLIDRKIANTKDEKINIGYDEALSEYEGYLDNVKLFEEDYKNQDYDGDGKTDRIFQYFRNDNKKVYTICFGMVTTLNWEHLMIHFSVLKYGERILPETGKMRLSFVESIQEIHGYRVEVKLQSGEKMAVSTQE